MHRRRFMQCLTAAAIAPAMPLRAVAAPLGDPGGTLRADPNKILDLPAGFEYRIVSRAGEPMKDGLQVPVAHDGMAAFAGDDGRVILVCNHEIEPQYWQYSAFGKMATVPETILSKMYDLGQGKTPGAGGTTTTIYNPATGETESQHLSLAGTELNCAGGATPWRSWLTCEECHFAPGFESGAYRDRPHGYVFEVPADADGLIDAVPLTDMGRFEHEAAAVHERSGVVYQTEDKRGGLFYRFIPKVPGKLVEGGKLQALAVGDDSLRTFNWNRKRRVKVGEPMPVHWVDLDDVDSDYDTLRGRGASEGAATFMRGEGLCISGDDVYFTATYGGPDLLGQVFRYSASEFEGTDEETTTPGTLELVAESSQDSVLKNPDNLCMAPWGDLIVCEDAKSHAGLIGCRPDGTQYTIADNAHSDSELAGVCFSPDGQVLFVNIQYPGMTLAITGPWPDA
ncbi:MAG: alkaline phosphatase PhoX [Pseudomonadota bacterium]